MLLCRLMDEVFFHPSKQKMTCLANPRGPRRRRVAPDRSRLPDLTVGWQITERRLSTMHRRSRSNLALLCLFGCTLQVRSSHTRH